MELYLHRPLRITSWEVPFVFTCLTFTKELDTFRHIISMQFWLNWINFKAVVQVDTFIKFCTQLRFDIHILTYQDLLSYFHIRIENLTSFLAGWKTLLTIVPVGARTHDLPQGVPDPAHLAIGMRWNAGDLTFLFDTYTCVSGPFLSLPGQRGSVTVVGD